MTLWQSGDAFCSLPDDRFGGDAEMLGNRAPAGADAPKSSMPTKASLIAQHPVPGLADGCLDGDARRMIRGPGFAPVAASCCQNNSMTGDRYNGGGNAFGCQAWSLRRIGDADFRAAGDQRDLPRHRRSPAAI